MLLQPAVRDAFDLDREPAALRAQYGDHICGQSTLLARRLTEAGVPMVTVYCAAGDLNGSVGAHFDTHGDNFNRLKNDMLPPLDQASATLLEDLHQRGRLDETLVVWLTEFGRTPKINGAGGRDHFPNCYSVAFAGGGIRGGQVYGASNSTGAEPADKACGPADLHATIFSALGIDPRHVIHDLTGRPHMLCDGHALPLV
jgi:arylsulfatase A-like enzyme